jgi:hypothetical protein
MPILFFSFCLWFFFPKQTEKELPEINTKKWVSFSTIDKNKIK